MAGMDMSQLIPGANFGGNNQSNPMSALASQPNAPAIGGGSNPFLPQFPSGTNTPPMDSTINMSGAPASRGIDNMGAGGGGGNDLQSLIQMLASGGGFPANGPGGAPGGGAPGQPSGNLGNFNLASALGLGQGDPNAAHNFVKAMRKAGYSSGVAGQLWNFLQSGAGFNPQIAQAMINFMQPNIQRGEADIAERYGAMGLGMSSPAAIGMGDFLSQVNLNENEIFAQMAEQATQNYMAVLMGGKGPAPSSGFDNFIKWLTAAGGAAAGSGQILQGI